MKPYAGPEVWFYFLIAALLAVAVTFIVFAFRNEKAEKSESDQTISSGFRKKKYGMFAGFALMAGATVYLVFSMNALSQETYRAAMVQAIESKNVKVVEGFVDPSAPLVPNSHAKFVITSADGLIRCRANAGAADQNVEFLCQDIDDKERDFTVPLETLQNSGSNENGNVPVIPATQVPTPSPSVAETEKTEK